MVSGIGATLYVKMVTVMVKKTVTTTLSKWSLQFFKQF